MAPSRSPLTRQEIVDAMTGAVLGEHEGAYSYTVGQRRGLRLGRPAAAPCGRWMRLGAARTRLRSEEPA